MVAEELLNLAAAQADHVRVLLLQPRLVVVLVAVVVHQVQLVHQAAGLEQLQRPVDGHAVQLGIFFARQLEQTLGIQMLAGLIDQIEQNLALAREPHASLFERIFDTGNRHSGWGLEPSRRLANWPIQCACFRKFQPDLVSQLGRAIYAAKHQPARIQQMLRPVMAGGPLATRLKFDAQEIPNLPVDTVANLARQFALGIGDPQVGLQRDRLVKLKTSAGKRDVFQVRHALPQMPTLILPLDIHQVRAQHPGFNAPVEHIPIYRRAKG